MPLNLNVDPYRDDFAPEKHFQKVLYRPKFAVQARELNTTQSILQDQITRLADNFFQHGAQLLGGRLTYDNNLAYVKLDDSVLTAAHFAALNPDDPSNAGSPVVIQGSTTGIRAVVYKAVTTVGQEPTTLLVKYITSGSNGTTKAFADAEQIVLVQNNIATSTVVAVTAASNSVGYGSAVNIAEGYYYIYGAMTRVEPQTLILSKYSNAPTVRVGLTVQESFITPELDSSLVDNAQGTTNYAAPGAHRYKVDLILDTRDVNSTDDDTFVELLRLNNGVIQKVVNTTDYAIIGDTLARRTFDTNGDFTVRPFLLKLFENLNDGNNNGLKTSTQGGDSSKLTLALSPGKAYVRGYDIETVTTEYLDVPKARETATYKNSTTRAYLGNYVLVNNLYNMPNVDQQPLIYLCDAGNTVPGTQSGNQIGTARVRALEKANIGTGVYNMYLYDVTLIAGQSIKDVYSFYIPVQAGSSVACTGDILSQHQMRNATGNFTVGDLYGDGVASEFVVFWDAYSGTLLGQPGPNRLRDNTMVHNQANTVQALLFQTTKLFDTKDNILLYPLPQPNIQSVRAADGSVNATYLYRELFSTTTSDTTALFVSGGDTFAPFDSQNYIAVIQSGSDAGTVINLTSANVTFPNSNQCQITGIPGTGARSIKLSATLIRTNAQEKQKILQNNLASPLVVSAPIPQKIGLLKPDIYRLISIVDSTSADVTDRFALDNGQRDNKYDIGTITLKQNVPLPEGSITIQYEYFEHSGSGDYFSVNSYQNFDNNDADWYSNIPSYTSQYGQNFALRDVLDFRPTVDDVGSYTQLTGASITNPGKLIPPGNDFASDFSYYLGRIDKVYLDYTGAFGVIKGTPAINPVEPPDPKNGMVLYVLKFGPYTYSTKDVAVTFVENKRYTMRDIGKLDTRITGLERYAVLSSLEKETADLSIIDTSTGLERFKSGFLVDTFQGHSNGNVFAPDYRCSMDVTRGTMRPPYTAASIPLVLDESTSVNYEYRNKKGSNDLITLPYSEVAFISQPLASRTEKVNPFSVFNWVGSLALDPPTDDWKDTTSRPDVVMNPEGEYDSLLFLPEAKRTYGSIWNEWTRNWTGVSADLTSQPAGIKTLLSGQNYNGAGSVPLIPVEIAGNIINQNNPSGSVDQIRYQSENTVTDLVDNRVIDISYVPSIRSRWIKVTASRLKPNTQVFPFFDGADVSNWCKSVDPDHRDDPAYPSGDIQTNNHTLVTDSFGNVSCWFYLTNSAGQNFHAGKRLFRLTDSPLNDPTDTTTFADCIYEVAGVIESHQKSITSTRTAQIQKQTVYDNKTVTDTKQSSLPIFASVPSSHYANAVSPLGQSFTISQLDGGCFVSSIQLFFSSVDENNIPITLQLREVENGAPTQKVIPGSEVTLNPADISLSSSPISPLVPTTFSFEFPVRLENDTTYAFVLLSNSSQYSVYTAKLGETLINSDRIISQQPYVGSMYSSQNASGWTAEVNESITFTMSRCSFDTTSDAQVYFYNKTEDATVLPPQSIMTTKGSKVIRILHPDHGMPVNSWVTVGLPATDYTANATYNGIEVQHIVSAPLDGAVYGYGTYQITDVRMDSYCINISASAVASDSGFTGNAVTVTGQHQMDVLCPNIGQLIFSGTNIIWSVKTTSGRSVDGNQTAYVIDQDLKPITVNQNYLMPHPALVASSLNETKMLSGGHSLVFESVLSTSRENISPVIDMSRVSAIVIANRIDNASSVNALYDGVDNFQENRLVTTDSTFTATTIASSTTIFPASWAHKFIGISGTTQNNTTFPYLVKVIAVSVDGHTLTVAPTNPSKTGLTNEGPVAATFSLYENFIDETSPSSGSALAKYSNRRGTLVNPADALQVSLVAMKPLVGDIEVYYRTVGLDQQAAVVEQLPWIPMIPDANSDMSPSTNQYDFKQYVWIANDIPTFTTFEAKIVLKTTDTTQVPVCDDIKIVALAT